MKGSDLEPYIASSAVRYMGSDCHCDLRNDGGHATWVVYIKRLFITVRNFDPADKVGLSERYTALDFMHLSACSGKTFEVLSAVPGLPIAEISYASTQHQDVIAAISYLSQMISGLGAETQHFVGLAPHRRRDRILTKDRVLCLS